MIRFILINTIFIQFCFSIPLLNRLIVPIYYSTSFSYGYDSNVLKFSEEEKLDSETEPWLLGRNMLTSSVVKGSVSFIYIPYTISGHETQLNVKFNYSNFVDSNDKKYYSYLFKLSQHLGHYEWVKVSYSLLPHLYLREYIDRDNPIYYFYDSSTFFSIENLQVQYSHSIPFKKSYFSISYNLQKQYYNGEFTEFDLDINGFKVGIYLRNISHIKISANLSNSMADNISFQDGHFSTQTKDRGYEQNRFWVSLSVDDKYIPIFNELGTSFSIEKRAFSSALVSDPLHRGRTHTDQKFSLWLKKNISKKLDVKIFGSYRSRSTNSEVEFVEGLKSFNKYDFYMTFTYQSNFNIYY